VFAALKIPAVDWAGLLTREAPDSGLRDTSRCFVAPGQRFPQLDWLNSGMLIGAWEALELTLVNKAQTPVD
jgi:hypothetical protein